MFPTLFGLLREKWSACRKLMAGRTEGVPLRPKARRPRPTVKPMLEALEDLILLSTYYWSPPNPQTNINASNAGNWEVNGQRPNAAPGPTDNVAFDPGSEVNGNADIIWDYNATFTTMFLGGSEAYTGRQTIGANTKVELTGAGSPATSLDTVVNSSNLYLYFGGAGAYFQIDANAEITNMALAGSPNGFFAIQGGTTTMAQAPVGQDTPYTETIGVPMIIASGATLTDYSKNALTFTNDDLFIHVDGEMDVYHGTGTLAALINNSGAFSHNYIDVDYGTLKYLGQSGVKDTFTVPVLVEYIGTFAVTGDGGPSGTLIVQGVVPGQIINASVYVTGSGSVKLSSSATLECDSDYYQYSGTLVTTDTTTCTLQDGPTSAGTVAINSGFVQIAPGSYGELDVKCGLLLFNGELDVDIAGYQNPGANPGQSDKLVVVNGNIYLQSSSSLVVTVNGQAALTKNDYWFIISAKQFGWEDPNLIWHDYDFRTKTSNAQGNFIYDFNWPNQGQYGIDYQG